MPVVTLTGSVGEGGKNRPKDVEKLRDLLQSAGILPADRTYPIRVKEERKGSKTIRTVDAWLIDAITDFQKLCGTTADGRVDSPGGTLRRLNVLSNPLVLQPMKTNRRTEGAKMLKSGGFRISYTGVNGTRAEIPSGYQVLFGPTALPGTKMDISTRPPNDVIDEKNVGELLEMIGKIRKWGSTAQFELVLKLKDRELSKSAPKALTCPVHPHNGKLLPLDQSSGNGPVLTYQGNVEKEEFYGRTIVQIPGVSGYWFMYYSGFETDPKHRGFDCTTYAGTVLGVDFAKQVNGKTVADAAGATECKLTKTDDKGKQSEVTLTNASAADIKAFFATRRTGTFILWHSSHVVLVRDQTVYEFAGSANGYRTTAAGTWLDKYKKTKMTVRKATKS